jgi:hypothetical protein
MFRTAWRKWLGSNKRVSARLDRRRRLFLEPLEVRTVPSFAAPAVFDLGAVVKAVAVGQFEGAGAPLDIVTAEANGTVRVLRGNGDGTLNSPTTIPLETTPSLMAVGDLLGNGRDDIVTANTNGTLSVIFSNGDGTFQSPETVTLGGSVKALQLGDFLANGRQDILAAKPDGTLDVLLTNSDGTFQSPVVSQAGSRVNDAAVGDFRGDGKADVALATPTGLTIMEGNGDGTLSVSNTINFGVDEYGFQRSAADVRAVSLRANGALDLLVNNGSQVLFGNGDGTFQDVKASGVSGRAFTVGDFNGDGKPDIAQVNFTLPFSPPTLSLLAGNGDGTFHFGGTTQISLFDDVLAAGDFRGIGRSDLVLVSSFNHLLTVLPSNSDGTFATAPSITPTDFVAPAATGVFTSSGRQDIVLKGQTGNGVAIVKVLFNNGDGTFTQGPNLSLDTLATPTSVVVGDFNGDGNQDIAVDTNNGKLVVFLGNGDGTFQAGQTMTLGDGLDVLGTMVVGDFNHDGNLDIAVRSLQLPHFAGQNDAGQVTVLLGNGDGTFTVGSVFNVGPATGTLATADLHGNGTQDLITTSGNGVNATVDVLFGNGDGTFQNPVVVFVGDRSIGLAVGDFLGHNRNDLLVTSFDGTVKVLANNGDGTFQSPIVCQIGFILGAPQAADFFGDGKLSLVGINNNDNVVVVLRGNGDGTFQAPVDYLGDFQPGVPVVGDFNGDGKPDLAVGNSFQRQTSILINTSPAPSNADPVATSISMTTDVGTAVFGQPVTLIATVTADSGIAHGSVMVFDGNTPLGESALDGNGQAFLTLPFGVGVHSLHATFLGIAPFTDSTSASVSETITKADAMTFLFAQIICSNEVEFDVHVAAAALGAGTPTGTVTIFVDGNQAIGTATVNANGDVFFDINVPAGHHTFTAVYNGDGNLNTSTSNAIVLDI